MQQSAASLLAAAAVAVAVACLALAPSAHAQGPSGSGSGAMLSCTAKLVPCAGYLNATSTAAAPAAACCGPLREAAANETACLCAMLLNRAALREFGVAPEQGLLLAKRCNVTTDASACSAAGAGAGAGATTGGSTAASSASTGGSASSSSSVTKPTANGGGLARRLSFSGAASSLLGFSFIWWMITA